MKRKIKQYKSLIVTIIISGIAVLIASILLILNIFIPVKYISVYFTAKAERLEEGQARITFIDVGFGDSTLIEFPDGKNLLIDGGDGSRKNQKEILKVLNSRDIDRIDYLICSSVSETRCGGLAEIIKYKSVGTVFSPYVYATYLNDEFRAFSVAINKSRAELKICEYGKGVFGKDYYFCFLSPSAHTLEGGEYEKLNNDPSVENRRNASAVVYAEICGVGIMFLGGVTAQIQKGICSSYSVSGCFEFVEQKVKFDNLRIVKMAANGADFAACSEIYDLLKPRVAVLSVGENALGCPSANAISDAQRYVREDLYRTDEEGNITFTLKNGEYKKL